MRKCKADKNKNFVLTASASKFVSHFGRLGKRWGLEEDTCRVHALLYLSARVMSEDEIRTFFRFTKERCESVIDDLLQWKVAVKTSDGIKIIAGEPFDLIFSALRERAIREINPTLAVLSECKRLAEKEYETPDVTAHRFSDMYKTVEDLAAIEIQTRKINPKKMSTIIGLGGKTARLAKRISKKNNS